MKVSNMTSSNGNKIANQFIITDVVNKLSGNAVEYFQSYESMIAKRDCFRAGITNRQVWLDQKYWNYSRTTLKYLNQFLGTNSKKEIEKKIASGEYTLANLN